MPTWVLGLAFIFGLVAVVAATTAIVSSVLYRSQKIRKNNLIKNKSGIEKLNEKVRNSKNEVEIEKLLSKRTKLETKLRKRLQSFFKISKGVKTDYLRNSFLDNQTNLADPTLDARYTFTDIKKQEMDKYNAATRVAKKANEKKSKKVVKKQRKQTTTKTTTKTSTETVTETTTKVENDKQNTSESSVTSLEEEKRTLPVFGEEFIYPTHISDEDAKVN